MKDFRVAREEPTTVTDMQRIFDVIAWKRQHREVGIQMRSKLLRRIAPQ